MWGKKEILTTLVSRELFLITPDKKAYLRDVLDHVLRMEEKLSETKDLW
jgi:Mg2+ and Co2+ transporter CorA